MLFALAVFALPPEAIAAEPQGLARLWQIAKEKLRLWPFRHQEWPLFGYT
jgi:hypothetical protein